MLSGGEGVVAAAEKRFGIKVDVDAAMIGGYVQMEGLVSDGADSRRERSGDQDIIDTLRAV